MVENRLSSPRQKGTFALDPPSIAARSTSTVTVSISGLLTTDKIDVECREALEQGLVCEAAYCASNGVLSIRMGNFTNSAVDGASRTWAYWAW